MQSNAHMRLHRWPAVLFALASLVLPACKPSEPTPEQIQALLVRKPEILYAAIEAHPAEFMAVVDRAARSSQGVRQAMAAVADSQRIEEELRHPRTVPIDHRAVLGNVAAPVTIVEYTDLQCPFCRQERDVLVQLFKRYGDRVRLVVKQMPVTELHPYAMDGALMFEAVARQDPNFAYRLYDDVYAHQDQFSREGQRFLERSAVRVGADLSRALRDQRSPEVMARVQADMAEGKRLGFTGTPGFLVNGVSLQGAYPLQAFEQLIDRELASRPLAFATPGGGP